MKIHLPTFCLVLLALFSVPTTAFSIKEGSNFTCPVGQLEWEVQLSDSCFQLPRAVGQCPSLYLCNGVNLFEMGAIIYIKLCATITRILFTIKTHELVYTWQHVEKVKLAVMEGLSQPLLTTDLVQLLQAKQEEGIIRPVLHRHCQVCQRDNLPRHGLGGKAGHVRLDQRHLVTATEH